MPNVKLLFCGTENSETNDRHLECFRNVNNEIFIQITPPDHYFNWICLDKSTAIKLHRELKKQISFLND